MNWVYVGLAVGLGCLAAWRLRRRSYRRDDDELRRAVSPWWVPVGVAVGAVLASPFYRDSAAVVIGTYLLALVWALVLVIIDLDVHRLPDLLTLPAYPVLAVLLLACSVATGDWAALLRAGICAAVAFVVFFTAVILSPGAEGLGFGDAKLAGVLGGLLGWIAWTNAVMGLLSGFIVGGLVAVVLLVLRRASRKSSIAFGPAMILGAYLWCLLPTS